MWISNQADIDTVWNDIELLYFEDNVVKTFDEILSNISNQIHYELVWITRSKK